MRVAIQSSGFAMTNALRLSTEHRLATALGWARGHMRKLAVWLSDVNGPRGGIDKRCKIQVQLDNGREVIIEEREADLYAAIDRAAERADRAIVRQVERTREFAHERMPSPLEAGKDADGPDTPDRRDDVAHR
jgi:putative sigma-54 modulation protein